MLDQQTQYETLLCDYSNPLEAVNLLRGYRPYFELIPSMRRPKDSVLSVPLPVVKFAQRRDHHNHVKLPCDVAMLMCDPDWRIKTEVEIITMIHRPGEDFSDLLNRWRDVEVIQGEDFYWLLPWKHRQVISEKGNLQYPLFVTLSYTPERIKKGLEGAGFPYVTVELPEQEASPPEPTETVSADRGD
ncbi:hypothetical protein [Thalassoporum mexicanum]|uniref:hypothetical protein n=1 Tax=Thalassoporum mexicanum TaxID=3457544 RepID=UPI0002E39422|nr:hypothetical protein [Pseudanabaena sp. PCC 7367]